jgi:hypothetical protein
VTAVITSRALDIPAASCVVVLYVLRHAVFDVLRPGTSRLAPRTARSSSIPVFDHDLHRDCFGSRATSVPDELFSRPVSWRMLPEHGRQFMISDQLDVSVYFRHGIRLGSSFARKLTMSFRPQ